MGITNPFYQPKQTHYFNRSLFSYFLFLLFDQIQCIMSVPSTANQYIFESYILFYCGIQYTILVVMVTSATGGWGKAGAVLQDMYFFFL